MTRQAKPVPRRDGLNGEYYDHAGHGDLRFQRCGDCGTWRHMPRYTCASCGSASWSWEKSSGRGTLYSWTVTHRSFHPGFNQDVPYAVVVVEMEEGVRVVSQIEGIEPSAYRLGMKLAAVFAQRDDVSLPVFKPAPE